MPDKPTQVTNHEKVSVEDLLRLKRAERPDGAFWGRFDHELHQRMLQTLVKKDPWYVQVTRGVSGRFAQSLTVGAAAVFAALLVLRPGADLSPVGVATEPVVVPTSTSQLATAAPLAEAVSRGLSYKDVSSQAQSRDYGADTITANANFEDTGFRRDFEMDRIQFASSDSIAYSEAAATRVSYATPGVASLVY